MINILSYKAWALERNFISRVAPMVLKMISEGKSLDALVDQKELTEEMLSNRYAMSVGRDAQSGLWYVTNSQKQNVAIIPVIGSLTKRGDLCSWGMRDYMGWIDAMNRSDNLIGAVMEMEGPGGTVDGTPEFGMAVKNSEKPIVVFGDSMVASAHYWVASQASHIIANVNNPTEFGSIGVLYVHEYWGKYIEDNIGSIEIIRAPQSVDKALINPFEQLTEDQRTELLEDLREMGDAFEATVKGGRGDKLSTEENVFTGKMYKSKKALELGLIDQEGTFMDALDKVGELATSSPSVGGETTPQTEGDSNEDQPSASIPEKGNKQVNNKNSNMRILQWLGISTESAEKLTAEDKMALGTAEGKLTKLEAENSVLKEQLQSANELIGEQKADAKVKDAKIAELNTKLDGSPAAAVPGTNEDEDEGHDANQAAIDALPHNKNVDSDPRFSNQDSKPKTDD